MNLKENAPHFQSSSAVQLRPHRGVNGLVLLVLHCEPWQTRKAMPFCTHSLLKLLFNKGWLVDKKHSAGKIGKNWFCQSNAAKHAETEGMMHGHVTIHVWWNPLQPSNLWVKRCSGVKSQSQPFRKCVFCFKLSPAKHNAKMTHWGNALRSRHLVLNACRCWVKWLVANDQYW